MQGKLNVCVSNEPTQRGYMYTVQSEVRVGNRRTFVVRRFGFAPSRSMAYRDGAKVMRQMLFRRNAIMNRIEES